MKEKDEAEFNLSEGEIEGFVKNRVWKLIIEDVLGKALIESEECDILDPMTDGVKLARNQGSIRMAKWLAELPRLYAEQAKITKEEEKRNDVRK